MKVYISCVKNLFSDEMYEKLRTQASEKRKLKAEKLTKLEDKVRCLYTELLIKKMHPAHPENGFSYDDRGKPYITGGAPFSISHSGGAVALAVAESMVGVDIQVAVPVNEKIFDRVLSENEMAFLEGEGDKMDAFFKLWVMKEAVVKAMGTGFKVPPRKIECANSGGLISCIEHNGKNLYITLFEPWTGYKLAVCGSKPAEKYEIIKPEEII